jgi:hypothetical protein
MSPRTARSPTPSDRKATSPASVLVSPRTVSRPITSSEEKITFLKQQFKKKIGTDTGTQSLPSSPRYEVPSSYSSTGKNQHRHGF